MTLTTAKAGAKGRIGLPLAGRVRRLVGCFYLSMGGVHIGIVAADTELYRHFADAALLDVVSTAWGEVFMAQPVFWGLAMAAGETALGALLLSSGPRVRLGWAGVVAFHVLLMLFGWGYWLWSLPVLAGLVPVATRDWPHLAHRPDGGEARRHRPAETPATGTAPR
jgi:hypothetical protein